MSEDLCKWHEGEDSIDRNEVPPGCQNCGTLYDTKTCKGCGLEFLDWESSGFDDVIAPPRVDSYGDLCCERCLSGIEWSIAEQEESNAAYFPDEPSVDDIRDDYEILGED